MDEGRPGKEVTVTSFLLVSYVLLWVVVVIAVLVLAATVRQVGLIHMRIPAIGARSAQPGPAVGDQVPEVLTRDLTGAQIVLGGTRERSSLVVFVSTNCATCDQIGPALRSVARSERSETDLVLVMDGSPEAVAAYQERHRLKGVPLLTDEAVRTTYGVLTTPYGLMIDNAGTLKGKGMVNNIEHLESLLRAGETGIDSIETFFDITSRDDRVGEDNERSIVE
jgi:methylamine dehydrogenase accessory protein MauD